MRTVGGDGEGVGNMFSIEDADSTTGRRGDGLRTGVLVGALFLSTFGEEGLDALSRFGVLFLDEEAVWKVPFLGDTREVGLAGVSLVFG